jgi:hypothetical protein
MSTQYADDLVVVHPDAAERWGGAGPVDGLIWREPQRYLDYGRNYHAPGPYSRVMRSCSYCGSAHPIDLLAACERGDVVAMEVADLKYGYPHKIYIDLPNPIAGETVQIGSVSEPGKATVPTMGAAPALVHAKFYLRHLSVLSEDEFMRLSSEIAKRTPLTLERRGDSMYWEITSNRASTGAP